MPGPEFVRFVSPVKGRLVSRWDAPGTLIGARLTTAAERATGAEPIIWDEELVLPLTDAFCRRFDKELRRALANGDLKKRKREDYESWLKAEAKREADRAVARRAAEKPAKAPAEPETPTRKK